jgi:hypothetical protein
VRRPGGGAHFLAVLEHQGSGVVLVGLTPLGQRLVRARWSAEGIQVDLAPQAAPYLDAEAILRLLAFALWPEAALRAALGPGPYSAVFSPDRRVLSWNGEELLSVVRSGPPGQEAWLLRQAGQEGAIKVTELQGVQP